MNFYKKELNKKINDAIIIGGGFYGLSIAIYLSRVRGLKKIIVLEREPEILARASYNNQARVHNGYHYPRSFLTGFRSQINYPRFISDYSSAIFNDFNQIYAIARKNSKVNARQFIRFCDEIGAKTILAKSPITSLFNERLIEKVFNVEESAFNANLLKKYLIRELKKENIQILLNSNVKKIAYRNKESVSLFLNNSISKETELLNARYVFNCTYSGLNCIEGFFAENKGRLEIKHEIAEIALIKPPPVLKHLGVTVMDGPFFSTMPFPDKKLHSLTHVRYTPHHHWADKKEINPYKQISQYANASKANRMIRDASRFLPIISNSIYMGSLYEVKSILAMNETDDGRPILFEKHKNLPGCYSVLGGKIDNIYDIFEKLNQEIFIIIC